MRDAAFVYCPDYEADIGSHVFPTQKYRLVRDRLVELGIPAHAFVEPGEGDRRQIALAHEARYLEDFFSLKTTPATVTSELPITTEIVRWFELAVQGTVKASVLALERGASMHIGGGFHHAFADHAEGFCYLNDTAVGARVMLGDNGSGVERISVVDVDVHQGNGTARIFHGDPRVFTFSIHQENNYPAKEKSDLDIGLPDGMDDSGYLEFLARGLHTSVHEIQPDLVYYVAGADPYREDQLGGLGLTLEGLQERDRLVFSACREVGAKVVALLAGGYAANLDDTVTIHTQTGQEMLRVWPLDLPGS